MIIVRQIVNLNFPRLYYYTKAKWYKNNSYNVILYIKYRFSRDVHSRFLFECSNFHTRCIQRMCENTQCEEPPELITPLLTNPLL